MKKVLSLAVVTLMLIAATGCTDSPEQIARNSIATATGAISSAQADYTATCQQNPAQAVCKAINKTVDAQNFAITGLETYCGFSLTGTLPDPGTKCTPMKSAAGGLQTVITNLNLAVGELKALAPKKARNAPEPLPAQLPEPMQSELPGGAIALGLLGLKTLLDSVLKGKKGEIADDSISAIQGAIGEFEKVQGTDVTLGQLEEMRLHHLWPDAPGTVADATGTSTTTSSGSSGSAG